MIIVDRIVENIVVLEADGEIINVGIEKFALPVKEGDVVVTDSGLYVTDKPATEARRKSIIEKMKKMGLK